MKTNIPMKELYNLMIELEYLLKTLQDLPINATLTTEQLCLWTYQGLSEDLQWHKFLCSHHPVTNRRETIKIPVEKGNNYE
jgi:hypothetical protein